MTSIRDEWQPLIDEMKSDPNKGHFKKNEDWDHVDWDGMDPALKKEFIDFLISSCTAEFSGCVLYKEMKRLLLDIAFDVFCWVDDSEDTIPKINRAFSDMMEGALGIVRLDVPGFLYHRGLEGRRFLKRFFMDMIDTKRQSNDGDVFAHFCKEKTESGEYYSDEDIAGAAAAVEGKTEMDAIIAYLQGMGTAIKTRR